MSWPPTASHEPVLAGSTSLYRSGTQITPIIRCGSISMLPRCLVFASTLLLLATVAATAGDELSPVSERAMRIHTAGLLFDGHNDLPFRLRNNDDVTFTKIDISRLLDSGRTDIPRLRQGGVDAQFWSVYIESDDHNPARSVTQQIDLVYRMADRYADTFEMAFSADDVERIASAG